MKSTGIVRRIDELGRVVIPKELRKTMHMREGEELEVYADGDSRLVLEKYSPINSMKKLADYYVDAINKNYGANVAVMDRDRIVACKCNIKSIYVGANISAFAESLMVARKSIMLSGSDLKPICNEGKNEVGFVAFAPIVNMGDILGAVCVFSINPIQDGLLKLATTAAELIAMQA